MAVEIEIDAIVVFDWVFEPFSGNLDHDTLMTDCKNLLRHFFARQGDPLFPWAKLVCRCDGKERTRSYSRLCCFCPLYEALSSWLCLCFLGNEKPFVNQKKKKIILLVASEALNKW